MSTRPTHHYLIVAAVILFVGVLALFLTLQPGAGPAGKEPISYDEAQTLLRLKNEGVAYLENERYGESDPLLERLTEELPNEVIGVQNLTICRLLQLTPEKLADQQAGKKLADQTLATVAQLIRIAPEASTSYVLSARIQQALGNESEAEAALKQALEKSPESAAIWFELSQLQKRSAKPEQQEQANTSLKRAWELQPDNLFLTIDYLQVAADQKSEQAQAVFAQVKQLAAPLVESVKDHTRLDLNQLIETSLQAIQDQKWNLVTRNARIVRNVLIAEDLVKSDRRRVEQNPLEFVIPDFPPAFYAAVEWPDQEKPLSVKFAEPEPLEFAGEAPADINDLQVTDFDLDGKPDLILLTAKQVQVFRQNQEGHWEAIVSASVDGDFSEIHAVDLDADVQQLTPQPAAGKKEEPPTIAPISPARDADLDLVLAGKSGMLVLENRADAKQGTRQLVLKPQVDSLDALRDVLAINFSDLDHDGDLDLVASTRKGLSLWSNRGNLSFQDISNNSKLPPAGLAATSIVRVDWDRDVDLDLILCSRTSRQAGYLENLRHGRFRWRTFDEVDPKSAVNQFEECVLTDFDRNGSWDLVGVQEKKLLLAETRLPEPGRMQIASVKPMQGTEPVEGQHDVLKTGDLNNDGVLDVVTLSSKQLQVLLGSAQHRTGQTAFVADQVMTNSKPIQRFRLADLNQDGSLDVIAVVSDKVIQWQNQGNDYHWIDVSLRAEQVKGEVKSASGRVNHYGIGSLIELRSGAIYQPQIVAGQSTHFGLGKQTVAEALRVLWTNGIPVNIINAKTDQRIYEKQTLMGSCPYLYTWDGEQFTFYTDLLWAAPIGLQFGKGIVAPSRNWEYLRIDGDQLKAKDGYYELRVTEELWEAGYLDTVQLTAVDHPKEIDIFSNEKVGPPDLAEFKIHTVQNPQTPVAAVNQRGRDLLSEIKEVDDVYAKTFDEKYRQGLVEDHILELDLNTEAVRKAKAPRIRLFLTGWLYPTDTGINLALSENPALPSPRPPSLSVPDGKGNWKTIQPFMGFPGGKMKTIVVDLGDRFLTDDYRVRIETNMEFYWDQVFFTVDESSAELMTRVCPLETADLLFRGFSTPIIHPGNGPERYDYQSLSRQIQWPPMQGGFTRYGDVKPLVEQADNRLVILGAGDEMRLRFQVPEGPVRPGWKRDFILYNVGWDKDANLHTILGQSVEPLPFREMQSYPYPTEEYPADAVLQSDREQYHTRRQSSAAFWKHLQRP
ncbi:FG-GAP repeat protein [Gimesia panareensis]|uniref:FG-GAP repeat protein n=1 Tax=Gimesia panareensis TaxID=2527978 RepID=A0A518FH85_9PLAN|nr:CRTAC1 family protein [Gimesia panareensis]QDV15704.1 FG-GAP repeat protein [Gimesia panareensis]